jgi:hypothetical protein
MAKKGSTNKSGGNGKGGWSGGNGKGGVTRGSPLSRRPPRQPGR